MYLFFSWNLFIIAFRSSSWVQPRLNLARVLNPANPGELSKQVTRVCWIQVLSLPSLAGFIKTNKKPDFSWVCWVRCQSNKIHIYSWVCWVQEPSLPSLAGFIKTNRNKKPGFGWVCWVHCQSNKIHRAGSAGF